MTKEEAIRSYKEQAKLFGCETARWMIGHIPHLTPEDADKIEKEIIEENQDMLSKFDRSYRESGNKFFQK